MSDLLEFYKQRVEALEAENEKLRLQIATSRTVIDPIFLEPINK